MDKGTLYIVATPIGNLGDITLRALDTLKKVDHIAAEDTRVTRKLLSRYEISNKLVSFHEHSGEDKTQSIVDDLLEGKNVALVSDAGTPVISDPGYALVERCVEEGIGVESLPGANAAAVAVTLCGLDCRNFLFAGFLPNKSSARKKELQRLGAAGIPVVLYESPQRVVRTLRDIAELFGSGIQACAARELTKLHEETVRGTVGAILEDFGSRESIRGEFVLIFRPEAKDVEVTDEQIVAALEKEIAGGATKKEAVRIVTAGLSCPKNRVYHLLHGNKQ